MGRISKKLVQDMESEASDFEALTDEFASGLSDDIPSFEEMIKDGHDPVHALYVGAQNFASMFSEAITGEFNEFRPYCQAVEQAEETYKPQCPPLSPLTGSYFYSWALFDLRFGPDDETMGTCLLDLLTAMDAGSIMLDVLDNLQASRMGIYEHSGNRGHYVVLRELVTGDEFKCHSTSGYEGQTGELWYTRLCPPIEPADYHVVITTPYVLTGASSADWTAYLNKSMLAAGVADKRDGLRQLLKYGGGAMPWHEFVFQAYHHHQYDAIFLAGLPDVPASRPHAGIATDDLDEKNTAPPMISIQKFQSGGEADTAEVCCVKFSQAQRKLIARICPELAGGMMLDKKSPRSVELTLGELGRVQREADVVALQGRGSERTSARKIVAIAGGALLAAGHDGPVRSANDTSATRHSASTGQDSSSGLIYQLHISLKGSKPPIWRRIQIADCTLQQLHHTIQAAMGWYDSHLHEFDVQGTQYSSPPPFDDGSWQEMEAEDESQVRLSQVVPPKKGFRFNYLYDFGDSWEHVIKVESTGPPEPKKRYPVCVAGKCACPPEDCGGIWGYYDFVAAISDPNHQEHEEMMEWHGSYDAEAFDPATATRQMRRT